MKIKLKVALLLTMFVITSVLLLLPTKPVQASIYVMSGKLVVVNGMRCCICPGKEDDCGCGITINDL